MGQESYHLGQQGDPPLRRVRYACFRYRRHRRDRFRAVPELMTAGHEVLGLARSDASAQALTAVGVSVVRGDLNDPESLRAGAVQSDGVIHLAFGADFNNFEKSVAREAIAVEAFGAALEGSSK